MTRKDFEALAEALAACKPSGTYPTQPATTWDQCMHEIANVCSKSNPNFNRPKFFAACNS
jgi:hypothetical protein